MQFRRWLEAIDPEEYKKLRGEIEKARQKQFIKSQGGLGKAIHKARGVWMLPFRAAQKDPQEGWFIDWFDQPGSIQDLNDVSIGDKVADHSLNMTPYWTIAGIDEDKGRIYLTPIEPNPFTTGVGAGGKKLDQFDYDVHSGDYEKERVDRILDRIRQGQVHDIDDMKYLLLGTVPVNMGPNGAQGGWYNASDTMANRGGNKGFDAKTIMKKDAESLKQFGFSMPTKALTGELDPYLWSQFVNGETDPEKARETQVEGENFDDPNQMYKMIMQHPSPQIKIRNWEALVDQYKGYSRYRKEWRAKDYASEISDKWEAGGFTDKKFLPIIKKAAISISKLPPPKARRDPYWYLKEKAIIFASQHDWDDVVRMFEDSDTADNRRYIFYHYRGDRFGKEEKPQLKNIWRMLEKERHPKNLEEILSFLHKQEPEETEQWVKKHEDLLQKSMNDEIYGRDLKIVYGRIKNWRNLRSKFGF